MREEREDTYTKLEKNTAGIDRSGRPHLGLPIRPPHPFFFSLTKASLENVTGIVFQPPFRSELCFGGASLWVIPLPWFL